MDDLVLARQHLIRRGRRLVVVRDGRIVAESDEPGMAATLACLEAVRRLGPGSAMADRVVGRAAAWAAIWAGVSSCYGAVLSRPAESLLAAHGLSIEAARRVANIRDQNRRGLCPLEAAVAEAQSAEEAIEAIRRLIPTPQARHTP